MPDSIKVEITCAGCGKVFWEFPSNHRKYCSTECYGKSKRTERSKCKVCVKPVRRMRNTYCSRSCRNKELGFQQRGIASYSGLYWQLQKLYPNPEPCVLCGKRGEHRHHPDYNRPFDIVWLCESCHHKLHPKNRKVRTEPLFLHSQSQQSRTGDGL